jgi:DNA replication protein DnaC
LRRTSTDALVDRLTHHVHVLEMNGDSFRLKQSKRHIAPNNLSDHDLSD